MNVDALTLQPYQGEDALKAFLNYKDKWSIVLGLTSNSGSIDFQLKTLNTKPLYRLIIEKCMEWGTKNNLMFVIGGTHEDLLKEIRTFCPNHFFLVPGIGHQGGDFARIIENGLTADCGLICKLIQKNNLCLKWERFCRKSKRRSLEITGENEIHLINLKKKDSQQLCMMFIASKSWQRHIHKTVGQLKQIKQ